MTTAFETMQAAKYGVEIETSGLGQAALASAIKASIPGSTLGGSFDGNTVRLADGRVWRVVNDSSIRHTGHGTGEVVSPVLTYADLEMVQAVVRGLRAAGATVNETTAIHIHVSHAGLTAPAAARLAKMVRKQEKYIEAALKIQARRLGHYCKPTDETMVGRMNGIETMTDLARAWYGRNGSCSGRYDCTRYYGLNLNSLFFRGTVEFRWFEGTLHAGEVKAYIQLALALVAKAINTKAASGEQRAFNAASAKYDFRVVLLGLGLIGDEFKTARTHLLKNLPGSSAHKAPRAAAAVSAA